MEKTGTENALPQLVMKKALIIDDEPIINRLNKKILTGIDICSDCRNTLDCLKGEKIKLLNTYDIAIIDLNLLRKNGERLLEKIQKLKKKFPVLITSGYLRESASDYLKKYRHVGYIQKPYTMEDFISEVKNLLEA